MVPLAFWPASQRRGHHALDAGEGEQMPKLPFMQFYPADWLLDTRRLSLEAKGAWIELIVALWNSRNRGLLDTNLKETSTLFGTRTDKTRRILDELSHQKICEIEKLENGDLRIISRRMLREEKGRQATAERVRNHREKEASCNDLSNGSVTPACNAPVTPHISEGILQNTDKKAAAETFPRAREAEPNPAAAEFLDEEEKTASSRHSNAGEAKSDLPFFLVHLAVEFPGVNIPEEYRRARDKLAGQAPGEPYMRRWLAVELEKKPKPAPKYIKDFIPKGWLKFVQAKFPGTDFSKRWEMLAPKLQIQAQQHFIEEYRPAAAGQTPQPTKTNASKN